MPGFVSNPSSSRREVQTGGDGADRFRVGAGEGSDTVTDFGQGTDVVLLKGFAAAGGALAFADLDTNDDGALDDADERVAVDVASGRTVLDLGDFAPDGSTSVLTLLGLGGPLGAGDLVFA